MINIICVKKGKKIATQGKTRTSNPELSYANLSPLPLDYSTDPPKCRKNLSTYTGKLSFLTVTSIAGDPSPFHKI